MGAVDNIKFSLIKRKLSGVRAKRKPELKKLQAYKTLLIVSEDKKNYLLEDLLETFPKAKISFLFARPHKEDETAKGTYSYHPADFNLTGAIKNDKLNELLKRQFDLVLDLSKNELLTNFLLERLKTSFMIGKGSAETSFLYDLSINDSKSDSDFLNKTKQQITLLTQNE